MAEGQSLSIVCSEPIVWLTVFQSNGTIVYAGDESGLTEVQFPKGMYHLKMQTTKGLLVSKLIVY
jgi:hypothetical protein